MLPFGPILAQVVTLSVADRTEARYVATFDRHYEASTRPAVAARIDWRKLSLTMRYSPSLTVVPLEPRQRRELLVFNTAYIAAEYRWQRSALQASQTWGFGQQNFVVLALTDPRLGAISPTNNGAATTPTTGSTTPTGTGTPPSGTTPPASAPGNTPTNTPHAANTQENNYRAVHYATSITTVALQKTPTATTTLRAELSYLIGGATRPGDALLYPLVRGPRATGAAQYAIGHADTVATTVTVQYAVASVGASAWLAGAVETWTHTFDRNTSTVLGAGLNGSRSPAVNGFVAYSTFPTLLASITNTSEWARGRFRASFSANTAPVIDLVTSAVDPRLGLLALVGWQREKFSATVSGDSAFSLAAQSDLGALSIVGAGAGVSYLLGKAVSVDTGARVAYQKFQGQTVIPFSQTVFVGLNFGLDQRL